MPIATTDIHGLPAVDVDRPARGGGSEWVLEVGRAADNGAADEPITDQLQAPT